MMEAYACPRTVRVTPEVAWYLKHWLEGKSDHCVGTSYWLQGFSHHGLGSGQRRIKAISPKGVYSEGFPGGLGVKNLPANAGEVDLISESGRSPGEGNRKPSQYSCL